MALKMPCRTGRESQKYPFVRHCVQFLCWEGKVSSFAAVRELVTKTVANAKRMVGSATVSVTLPIGYVSIKQLRLSVVIND